MVQLSALKSVALTPRTIYFRSVHKLDFIHFPQFEAQYRQRNSMSPSSRQDGQPCFLCLIPFSASFPSLCPSFHDPFGNMPKSYSPGPSSPPVRGLSLPSCASWAKPMNPIFKLIIAYSIEPFGRLSKPAAFCFGSWWPSSSHGGSPSYSGSMTPSSADVVSRFEPKVFIAIPSDRPTLTLSKSVACAGSVVCC